MIADLNQPAKNWIADHLDNFASLLKQGHAPGCLIDLPGGIQIQVRLINCPDLYIRNDITVFNKGDNHA